MAPIGKEASSRKKRNTTSSFVLGGCVGAILTITCFSISKGMSVSTFDSCAPTKMMALEGNSNSNKAVSGKDDDNDNGWQQIDVFYGNREGMLVSPESNKKWYSQVDQDKLVYKYLGNMENGYFVDLASNDATMISNSYALETFHGWRGLCVEPNTKYWARLAYRKCDIVAAVVSSQRMESIDFNFGKWGSEKIKYKYFDKFENAMGGGIVASGMDNEKVTEETNIIVKRYTVTLGEIFSRHNVPKIIDYLSLDVEGAEYFVLSVFPLEEYKIRILTIERPTNQLKTFLESRDYKYIESIGRFGETIWAHSSEIDRINKIRAAVP
jgi:hypothetical protein